MFEKKIIVGKRENQMKNMRGKYKECLYIPFHVGPIGASESLALLFPSQLRILLASLRH